MTSRQPLARGDLVLVSFPFTDLSTQRIRPALIVGRVSGDDVVLAFITTRAHPAEAQAEYLLDPADPEYAATGLHAPSTIRLNKIATVHRDLVRRRIGLIGPKTAGAVARGLRYVFGL